MADLQATFSMSLFWQTIVDGPVAGEGPRYLFITGIPAEAKFLEALAAFEPFRQIRSPTFLSTKDGAHSRRAFLSFHDPDSGVKCLAQARQLNALSNCFDLPPACATLRDLMIGIDQIRSSVFFRFLRPSSTPPILFKPLQASLTFRTLQWLSDSSTRFVSLTFLRRPSLSLLDCLRPSVPSGFDSINSFRFVPVPSLSFSLSSHLDYLR
jgi:hypothetical protein